MGVCVFRDPPTMARVLLLVPFKATKKDTPMMSHEVIKPVGNERRAKDSSTRCLAMKDILSWVGCYTELKQVTEKR